MKCLESSTCRLYLPRELLSEVLTRLPVKSLLRFKCVSKLWVDLINCPCFIRSHLDNSKRRGRINIKIGRGFSISNYFHTLHLDLGNGYKAEARNLTLPLDHHGLVAGTCNGLVCLLGPPHEPVVFWNPSTQQYRHGPLLESYECGFGYDQNSQDYKFVTVVTGNFHDRWQTCKIYSLKSSSWCYQHDFYNDLFLVSTLVFASSVVHWVYSNRFGDRGSIVAVDLGTNKAPRSLSFPPGPFQYRFVKNWKLDSLNDSLCALYYDYNQQVDVWMMKNADDKSWGKLFSLSASVDILSWSPGLVAYAEDGRKVLILNHGVLQWYDIEKEKVVNDVDVLGDGDGDADSDSSIHETFTFYESLVPL
ncbi:F-box protein CPR1 [Sesamum alatum]|uniref:F-box protein CPR1 n=1 Tax=Sesamum alatum TaxID=300844 RepID=A0AAE1YMF4_9LAMI|nr:F-box protein CPR1 [Sesamum alatum]